MTNGLFRLFLLLLLSSSLGACCIAQNATVGKTPYLLLNEGTVKHVHPLSIDQVYYPLPFLAVWTSHQSFLIDQPSPPFTFNLIEKLNHMPRWRNISTLTTISTSLESHSEKPLPHEQSNDSPPPKAHIRWIISSEPLVVAIGTDLTPIRLIYGSEPSPDGVTLSGTYSLIRDSDLDRAATSLIVLDHWPPANQNLDEHKDLLSKQSRQIPLPTPTTLRDLLKTRPWLTNPPAN